MRRRGAFLAALLCLAVAAACSNGGDKGAAGRATTTTETPVPIAFRTTAFDVEAAADPAAGAASGAQAGIEATLNQWLELAVLGPLRSGQPAGDIGPVFTAAAGERIATTADRAAFVDEGLPPVQSMRAGTASLAMTALIDPDGTIPVVAVHLDLTLGGTVEGTPFGVEHTGDLFMIPEGDAWRIDGYDVRATRATAGATTTTTAAG
ncbi:MAG TPA: hypothetical protein VF244_04605 [Acidimicrobiales bacterium]